MAVTVVKQDLVRAVGIFGEAYVHKDSGTVRHPYKGIYKDLDDTNIYEKVTLDDITVKISLKLEEENETQA